MDNFFGMGVAFLLLAGGVFLFLLGFLHVYDRRLIENTPTSKCRAVALGPVELAGRVAAPKPLASLIAQLPCVFSQVDIQQLRQRGKSEAWATVHKQEFKLPFYVDDGTGKVEVDPHGAQVQLVPDVVYSTDQDSAQWDQRALDRSYEIKDSRSLNELLRDYCARRGIILDAPTRFTETNLSPGDPVYVLGTASEQPGPERIVVRSGLRCPLFIAESGEPQLVRFLRVRATRRLAAGAALSTIGFTLLLRALSASPSDAFVLSPAKAASASELLRVWAPYLRQAVSLAAPFLAVVGLLAYFIVIYNGLVGLRNEVDRAWSNIDVLLKQRFDLVPNLVEVCKGYMHHEQSTLESVTLARRSWAEALHPEQKFKAAQESRAALQQVLLSVENYPLLRANENFLQLQQTLTELEEQIADRRELYNASVGALNTRIAQIPDAWVAGVLGYAPRPFLGIPDAEAKPQIIMAEGR